MKLFSTCSLIAVLASTIDANQVGDEKFSYKDTYSAQSEAEDNGDDHWIRNDQYNGCLSQTELDNKFEVPIWEPVEGFKMQMETDEKTTQLYWKITVPDQYYFGLYVGHQHKTHETFVWKADGENSNYGNSELLSSEGNPTTTINCEKQIMENEVVFDCVRNISLYDKQDPFVIDRPVEAVYLINRIEPNLPEEQIQGTEIFKVHRTYKMAAYGAKPDDYYKSGVSLLQTGQFYFCLADAFNSNLWK